MYKPTHLPLSLHEAPWFNCSRSTISHGVGVVSLHIRLYEPQPQIHDSEAQT